MLFLAALIPCVTRVLLAGSSCVTDFYSKYMTGIRIEQRLFEDFFRASLPRLAAHLDGCGLPLSIVTTSWFMCLYVNTLPAETLLRVWDLLVLEEPCVLVRVGVALLKLHETDLLATHDFIELSHKLQQLGKGLWSADTLLNAAYKQIANASSAASRRALSALQQLQQTAYEVGSPLVDAVYEVRLREGLIQPESLRDDDEDAPPVVTQPLTERALALNAGGGLQPPRPTKPPTPLAAAAAAAARTFAAAPENVLAAAAAAEAEADRRMELSPSNSPSSSFRSPSLDELLGPSAGLPSEAAPSDAAPSDAAPSDVAPSDVAPSDVAPSDADADAAAAAAASPHLDAVGRMSAVAATCSSCDDALPSSSIAAAAAAAAPPPAAATAATAAAGQSVAEAADAVAHPGGGGATPPRTPPLRPHSSHSGGRSGAGGLVGGACASATTAVALGAQDTRGTVPRSEGLGSQPRSSSAYLVGSAPRLELTGRRVSSMHGVGSAQASRRFLREHVHTPRSTGQPLRGSPGRASWAGTGTEERADGAAGSSGGGSGSGARFARRAASMLEPGGEGVERGIVGGGNAGSGNAGGGTPHAEAYWRRSNSTNESMSDEEDEEEEEDDEEEEDEDEEEEAPRRRLVGRAAAAAVAAATRSQNLGDAHPVIDMSPAWAGEPGAPPHAVPSQRGGGKEGGPAEEAHGEALGGGAAREDGGEEEGREGLGGGLLGGGGRGPEDQLEATLSWQASIRAEAQRQRVRIEAQRQLALIQAGAAPEGTVGEDPAAP